MSGNAKAKQALREASLVWVGKLGQHLAALTSRLQTVADRLDRDQSEAISELQAATVHLASGTDEQISQALASLGPVWSPPQETEVLRLAASLRAFAAVMVGPASGQQGQIGPQAVASGSGSFVGAVGFQGTSLLAGEGSGNVAALFPASPGAQGVASTSSTPARSMASGDNMDTSGTETNAKRRWNQRGNRHPRPSKSPRRELDLAAEPWAKAATGLTPERPSRVACSTGRRGAHSCRGLASAHMDDCLVSGVPTMLGTGLIADWSAGHLRMSGAGISLAAPRLRPDVCYSRRGGALDLVGPGCPATGIRGGGPAVGGEATGLAWGLPRLPRGSAPGQTRLDSPGSCDAGEPLQHRRHWSFHTAGVAVSSRALGPRHPAHWCPAGYLGLPCPACAVYDAVSSTSSTGRIGLVEVGGVEHEDALWHLHAPLLPPFLSLCAAAVYRVVGLCTDFRRTSSRLGPFLAALSLGLRVLASGLWVCACIYHRPSLLGCLAILGELGALCLARISVRGWRPLLAPRAYPRLIAVVGAWVFWLSACLRSHLWPGLCLRFPLTQGRWPGLLLLLSRCLASGQVAGGRYFRRRGARPGPSSRPARGQQHMQCYRPTTHSRKAILLLYLCCIDAHALSMLSGLGHSLVPMMFPGTAGVQLMAHGFHEGRPVFSTGSIPPAQAEHDLCEVVPLGRSCNLLLSPSSRPRRQLAVFFGRPAAEPPLLPCPITMLADERLHGPGLHLRIALNLGSDGVDAGVVQLQSPLPGLPAEQLLFLPPDIGWNTVVLPVDLRPLGGGVCLVRCERSDTCGQVLAAALEQQGRFRKVSSVVATSGGFHLALSP